MKRETDFRAFEIDIEKIVYGGMGLGRHKGKVVFVPFSNPGDHLLVRPIDEKKTYIRAEIVRILAPGNGRTSPLCPHFEKCGGCHWQQLEYLRQVETKRQILEEMFHHRFPETLDLPIVMRACPQPFGYRSRARMQTRGSGSDSSVGFFRFASHSIEDVEHCPLFRPMLNDALRSLRQFKSQAGQDPKPQEWDMACSEEDSTWAATRTGSTPDEVLAPSIETGSSGEIILRRKIGEFQYATTPSVFFQANDFMISELVRLVLELGQNAGGSALDLFSGVGLFSMPLARYFKTLISVENSAASCRLCSANASMAGFDRIQIICADVFEWMQSQAVSAVRPWDLIVLDPPRTGAGIKVMERIKEWAPGTILYVSCDPQTLIRDLSRISPGDYQIESVEGLDLFPQTYHFETVVRLTNRLNGTWL
jgi:23S rRNA (uracil1939-C5)-methyltransferase